MLLSFLAAVLLPSNDLDVGYSKLYPELKMDIYRPDLATAELKPAVLVIHGGAWMAGTRKDMTQMCEALATQGFVAATVEYRLAPKNKWPAMLDDVQTAVRFLRANSAKYGIDPARLGAAGASAGGHLSLLLGMRDTRDPKPAEYPGYSSKVQAVVDLFGPTDLLTDFGPGMDFVYQAVLGKPKKDATAEIREASPINYIGPQTAPIFIFQGMADTLVPPAQSKKLEAALRKAARPVQSAYIEGLGHDVFSKDAAVQKASMDALAKATQFLKDSLSPAALRKAG